MHTIFVLYSDVSDERIFCFVFDCCVRDKYTLYLYFIVTLLPSVRCVLYLIVSLVISTHYTCSFIVTLVISALFVLYLIVTLVISAHYSFTLLPR